MEEDFDRWNRIKKDTHKKINSVGFKQREIFWLRLGQNIGNEEYGKGNEFQRPVLIVRKLTKDIFVGLPLTSTLKENDYFHQFSYNTKKGLVENSAMILQLKTFDKNRLMTRIGMINKIDFAKINEKISRLFIPSKD
ncbi:type II toxin-antitoxin system PemK/MazF family toxin [Halarcobacter ebronensis]|uniref:Toxin-antitoxin system protein n=1 Tax=Halarcobacter ebronensis TaxID=1462615 RepID=A0A4Q1ARU4_9BACT|nr:type II toxin-antitoxin system PemK/MazF family toxin [Halarcobacter ebronensis]QKF80764.1 toxin-antitoxin system, toxin component, MazF/PemK family [Halarcobacter ebronensis]RXK08557.1 hypothetical protein CRV07_01785 [Halarcobacter ebronensis]